MAKFEHRPGQPDASRGSDGRFAISPAKEDWWDLPLNHENVAAYHAGRLLNQLNWWLQTRFLFVYCPIMSPEDTRREVDSVFCELVKTSYVLQGTEGNPLVNDLREVQRESERVYGSESFADFVTAFANPPDELDDLLHRTTQDFCGELVMAAVVSGLASPLRAGQCCANAAERGCACGENSRCIEPICSFSLGDLFGGAKSDCGNTCRSCEPDFVFRADAVFLHRSTPDSAVLATNSFAPGGAELLDADQFDFDTPAGWNIYLARDRVLGCWGIEANYFNVDNWNASPSPIESAGGSVVQYATPIGNTFFPSILTARYDSELYSVELNLRRPLRSWLTLLAGFRFLELDEAGVTIAQDIGPGLNTATHAIRSHNALSGFQVGLDSQFNLTRRLSFQAIGKTGIYGNHATDGVSITQNVGPGFACEAEASPTAFVGEVDFALLYKVTRHVSVHGGYQLLWIDRVALASDQVNISDPANGVGGIDAGNDVFYHGAFVGLEYRR